MDITRNRKNNRSREAGNTTVSFSLFLFTLFFAPLAFGTTETWSLVTVEALTAVTGLVFFFPFPAGRKHLYTTPGLVPLLLLFGWMYFQCLPLPTAFVRSIAPNIAAAYQPVLDLPGFGQAETWIPLTVNRQATLLESLRLSAYALFYLLTVQLLSHSRALRITMTSVAGLTLCIVLLSILQRLTAPDTLFWFRKLDGKTAFGPWVNRNQYAGFMVMACPLVLAQFMIHRPAAEQQETFREKFLAFFADSSAAAHLLFGFAAVVAVASVFLTSSRGGIFSISFALLLFFLLLARQQKKIQQLPLLVLPACIFVFAGWFGLDPVLEKLNALVDPATGQLQDDRLLIWPDTLRIIADFPITGTGFGTFADIFPSYRTFYDHFFYEHAHNDVLELLTNGGLIAWIPAVWFLGTVLRTGYRKICTRRDRLSVFSAISAFSGLAGMLVFSLTDFNLHNGANGLYFAFLCGLLVAAGHTRRHSQHEPTLLPPVSSPAQIRWTALPVIAVYLVALLFLHGGAVLADRYYQQAKVIAASDRDAASRTADMVKLVELLGLAKKRNPFAGIYSYALANIREYQQRPAQAVQLSAEAAMKQPMNFAFLQQLALLIAPDDLHRGRRLLEAGYRRASQKALPLQTWAEFELGRRNRAEAVQLLSNALQENPDLVESVYPLMRRYRFAQEEVTATLPELTSVRISYWKQAQAEGRGKKAEFILKGVLDFLDREPTIEPHYLLQLYTYYQKKDKADKAADVLRRGIRLLPGYAHFHVLLGDYYLKKGIPYRAREEYEQALLLEPRNSGVRSRLRKLEAKQ
ncbi:MAG: O-antigen ligase family protein [Candidatus Electrothrix sp. YB6]